MIIGLTGGIGSGKSTVAGFFRELGVPVYDSDAEARQLMTDNVHVKQAIVELFGQASYKEGGLDRKYISGIVFSDRGKLEKLNKIVHPAVRKHFLDWAAAQDFPYVIQETALIYENQAQDQYHKVILVSAPKKVRVQRVMDRDGVSELRVLERMNNQLGDDEKRALADFIIENTALQRTREAVVAIHQKLMEEIPSNTAF